MIVGKLEMWPGGDPSKAYSLGTIVIVNDGTGSPGTGNYEVQLMKGARLAKTPGVWRRGRVLDFPRARLGIYDLIFRALGEIVGTRNPKVSVQLLEDPAAPSVAAIEEGTDHVTG